MKGYNDQCGYYRHFRQKINYVDKFYLRVHPGISARDIFVFPMTNFGVSVKLL
jgi:alpha-D-ribose 1-methylphosphonate 5-triphosphate synthase subunit PhnL